MSILQDAFQTPVIAATLVADPIVFVDVGAAVGVEEPWLTLLADLRRTKIAAFEPHPDSFANIARLANGEYHQIAIGDKPGKANFFLHGTGSSLVNRSKEIGHPLESIEVTVDTLSHLRDKGVIQSLDIVKTDAELTDLNVISSAGHYLDHEVLAVQCEFSMRGSVEEAPFRDYDSLLQPKGFLLFGLSTMRGPLGEIQGGNLLYVRSIFDLIAKSDPSVARIRGVKLFVIALCLSHLDTAYAIARALGDAEILTKEEAVSLRELALSWVYIPDTQSFSRWRVRASSILGNLTAIVAGGFWRGVSAPHSNRLENYRKLVRRPWRTTQRHASERLYANYYEMAQADANFVTRNSEPMKKAQTLENRTT